jgi:hypothetical protein
LEDLEHVYILVEDVLRNDSGNEEALLHLPI